MAKAKAPPKPITQETYDKLGGRPTTELDWETIKELCLIHCTHEEIGHIVKCDPDTLDSACKRANGMGFSQYYAIHSANGKASLRRRMYQKAVQGDVMMSIWLAKNYLKMSDKQEIKTETQVTITISPQEVRQALTQDEFIEAEATLIEETTES